MTKEALPSPDLDPSMQSQQRPSELAQDPTTTEQVTETDMNGTEEAQVVSPNACRFCYGEEPQLIQPCNCKGSMAYVHGHCLGQWLETRPSLRCDICNYSIQ